MLNFLRAEFFRAKKSTLIKVLILAGIIIPAILALFVNDFFANESVENQAYLFLVSLTPFLVFGSNIYSLVITYVKKPNDYYRLLLSQGLSKFSILAYDFVFYQLLVLVLGLISALTCILASGIINYSQGLEVFAGAKMFMDRFFRVYLMQVGVNSLIYILTYLMDSGVLAYLSNYIIYLGIAGFWGILKDKFSVFFLKAFSLIFPLSEFIDLINLPHGFSIFKTVFWLVLYPLLAIYLAYKIFSRREL